MSKVNTYNTAYTVYPAAVVRPNSTDAVAEAVKCAVKSGVKVQPRCGGHSFADYSIGGESGSVVVDLSKLQHFEMDNTTWHAKIGGGTLLKDVTERMHANGKRAMAHGTCPQVGIGGHATIGGLGPTSRQFGAALDHIVEVEVVLANGTVTRASESFQPDLFFAIRGAASSFGIVTEFVVKTEPEPAETVHYSYNFVFGWKNMAQTFATWQKIISDPNLDRRLASQVTVSPIAMIISGSFFGSLAEYKALGFEDKLKGNATSSKVTVIDDWLGTVLNWAEGEALAIAGGLAAPFYSKSLNFRPDTLIPQDGIDALFEYFEKADKGTPIWVAIFDLEGGAINDVPLESTAYGHRDTLYYIQTYGIGIIQLSETTKNYLNGINDVIKAHMPGVDFGAYAGYVDPLLGDDAQRQYFGTNLPKLQAVKAAVDPTEVFWNPQSIKPKA
ncbi:FAD-binding domain-containing protein [Exidia glandulosa HHB12029]|uniref:FAD-binding domain-containing protein n=1 Tax=Exidia glandulosa HHB12029 TaxID=1314781 RepID=A0A166B336_EXIGL|nr:FAD-binding domain-containing protein [Exidia glandulosa HHB12029]